MFFKKRVHSQFFFFLEIFIIFNTFSGIFLIIIMTWKPLTVSCFFKKNKYTKRLRNDENSFKFMLQMCKFGFKMKSGIKQKI